MKAKLFLIVIMGSVIANSAFGMHYYAGQPQVPQSYLSYRNLPVQPKKEEKSWYQWLKDKVTPKTTFQAGAMSAALGAATMYGAYKTFGLPEEMPMSHAVGGAAFFGSVISALWFAALGVPIIMQQDAEAAENLIRYVLSNEVAFPTRQSKIDALEVQKNDENFWLLISDPRYLQMPSWRVASGKVLTELKKSAVLSGEEVVDAERNNLKEKLKNTQSLEGRLALVTEWLKANDPDLVQIDKDSATLKKFPILVLGVLINSSPSETIERKRGQVDQLLFENNKLKEKLNDEMFRIPKKIALLSLKEHLTAQINFEQFLKN